MSKYGAKKIEYKGTIFDSTAECDYYKFIESKIEQGEIKSVTLQPKYQIISKVGNYKPTYYVADFEVTFKDDAIAVIDVKGMATPEAKLKRKLFMEKYPNHELIWICKAPKYWTAETGENWIEYDLLQKVIAKRRRMKKAEGKS